MADKLQEIERLLSQRSMLHNRYKTQHRNLEPDRNKTAGEIYENTKSMVSAAKALVDSVRREEYADGWVSVMYDWNFEK